MSGQRVAYIRVSSLDQNVRRQLDGVAVDRTFTDTASGKDVTRPQLAAMPGFVREGDTVTCTRWTAWPATSRTSGGSCGS